MGEYLSREKLFGISRHKHFNLGIFVIALLLLLDLVYLNYKILIPKTEKDASVIQSDSQEQNKTEGTNISKSQDACGEACLTAINEAVTAATSNKTSKATTTTRSTSSVKEYFIPFGSSSSSATSWSDVPGLEAYIDSGAYGSIKKVTFEATTHVPTGNQTVNLRLYNATAKYPVWYSDLVFSGGTTAELLTSQSVTLDSGNNLYKVQAQTQLGFPASVNQARVHIITN